jgi:hypothetical protein
MTLNRSLLAIAAGLLAALAAIVANQDGDGDIVPFFVALTLAAGIAAWAVHEPFVGPRRTLARGIAVAWLGAAGWIGVLLLWFQAACGCSMPAPIAPEATYLGLTATMYHLVGVYLGGALVTVAAFSRLLEPRAA